MMNNKNNYFASVRNIREAKGLTIKEVARDLKLNQRVLQEIETGKKKEQMLNVLKALLNILICLSMSCLFLYIIEQKKYT
jgi:transcriptional regulator with XRE-family HTH domain